MLLAVLLLPAASLNRVGAPVVPGFETSFVASAPTVSPAQYAARLDDLSPGLLRQLSENSCDGSDICEPFPPASPMACGTDTFSDICAPFPECGDICDPFPECGDICDPFPDPPSPPPAPPMPMTLTMRFQASGNVENYDEEKKAAMLKVIVKAAGLPEGTPGTLTVTPASVLVVATLIVENPGVAESALSSLRWNAGSAFALTELFLFAGIWGVEVESAPFFNAVPLTAASPPPALVDVTGSSQEVAPEGEDYGRSIAGLVLAICLPLIILACLVSVALLFRDNKSVAITRDPVPSAVDSKPKVDVEAVAVTSSASDQAMTMDHVKGALSKPTPKTVEVEMETPPAASPKAPASPKAAPASFASAVEPSAVVLETQTEPAKPATPLPPKPVAAHTKSSLGDSLRDGSYPELGHAGSQHFDVSDDSDEDSK